VQFRALVAKKASVSPRLRGKKTFRAIPCFSALVAKKNLGTSVAKIADALLHDPPLDISWRFLLPQLFRHLRKRIFLVSEI